MSRRADTAPVTSTLTVVDPAEAAGLRVLGVGAEESLDYTPAERRHVRRRSWALLRQLARPVRGMLWLTAALVVLSNAARAAMPLVIAWSIDDALPRALEAVRAGTDPTGVVVQTGALYAVTGLVGGVLLGLYQWLTAKASQRMLLALRVRVFRHTQRLSLGFHETYTSGRVISRQTSDLEALRELLDQGVSSLVSGVLFTAFTAVSILLLDPPSFLVILVAFVPVAIAVRWYQVRSEEAYRRSRVSSARSIVHFVETMTGIRAVQAFRRQRAGERAYARLATDYRDDMMHTLNLFGVLQPVLVAVGNLTVAALLLFGGLRVLSGDLAVGVLVALLLAGRRVFQPMEMVAMFYSSLQSATAALEKVSGLLEEEPAVVEPAHPVALPGAERPGEGVASGRIEFRDAVFGYGPDAVVLPEFDLTVPAGQTVAVVGQTGAGKSTLVKLIARFYDLTSGSLTLDGVELKDLAGADLRRNVVMVTQEAFLFSGTVGENIALGRPHASEAEIQAAARAVGAHEFILDLPEGYATDVSKRGGRLSAGQRQLVSFARAFLADPAVLILDEATSSLDLPSERLVQDGLERLLGNRTALIIAHRLSTVEIADRVLVVHDGRIVEDGSPTELVAAGGRFAALHRAWEDSLVGEG
ncbi:ABC transporter ATP-binding protein/permease [Micrococcus sp. ACRRV]|uniref:ABC transporter ATP-binding protein n=1 Tax=Micrococcus sp. ACRRV TaxID=2918203 RepID=UPI001EF2CDF5|nr:ABC transporter ATP-binding protein [Micrococcus sp. ACRRV]MCG7422901.1 ABC transporter ATP-binding protein/permease [Micrococcus sp. ACRRV]